MDFSYEFMMFQNGNHDTKEKLEYYPNFIMLLLGELKNLREAICSCQQKVTSSKTTRSANQSLEAPNHSMGPLKPHVKDIRPTLPQMPEMNVSQLTTSFPGSSYMPVNTTIGSVTSPLVEIPTEWNKLNNECDNAIFYAEREALADTTMHVTFVHSFRHEARICCVSFRCDGRYMAVGTRNSSIFIYEVESRKKYCELREYASHYGRYARPLPLNLCFNSDGRYLAVVDAKRIIIWDVAEKRIRSVFHGRYYYFEIRFSPDGRLVACCTDTGVLVLNIRDKFRMMESEGSYFDFSPHGRYIATGNNGVFVILDVRTGKAVKGWNGHGEYLRKVKFTSDGKGLLCVYDDMIEQWDVSHAEPVLMRKFDVPANYISGASISPNHRLVVFDNQIWHVDGGKRQYTLQGHNSLIYCVDFSAAGTYLVIGSWDGFVSIWKYTQTSLSVCAVPPHPPAAIDSNITSL